MKKIIKLAAAFAVSGAMLATVGCQQIYEDIDDINAEIERIETTDLVTLRSKIETCIADIARVEAAYKADDAALKAELAAAYQAADAQLMLAAQALAGQLTAEYNTKMATLQNTLSAVLAQFTAQIGVLQKKDSTLAAKDIELSAEILSAIESFQKAEKDLKAADEVINKAIDSLELKLSGADNSLKAEISGNLNDAKAALEKAIHGVDSTLNVGIAKNALDIAGIKKDIDSLGKDIDSLGTDHANKYAELLVKISDQNAALEAAKTALNVAIAAGDSINAAALKAAKAEFEQALKDAKGELQEAIYFDIDSLAGVTVQIASDLAELKTLVNDYKNALYVKIKADSTTTNARIDEIKADYLAKYTELVGADTVILKSIDSLKAVYDAKVAALETKDGELGTLISGLRTEYEGKVNEIELELKKLNTVDSATAVRIDTLVASVYDRISKVNEALRDSIAKTLVDAKAYTDAQITALDLDNKLASMSAAFADSIKNIRTAYIKQVDSVDSKYKSIVDKLAAKIQSIVAVPSAEYQITYYTLSGNSIGDVKIGASFEVLPKEAAEKVTKANAQLHIRMALASSYVEENRHLSDEIAVVDTVLTGNSLGAVKVDKSKGIVTIEAVLPVKKDLNGVPEYAPEGMKTFFSLGVSDFAATYNEIQSEYAAATRKNFELLNCLGWYIADTLVTEGESIVKELSDTASNKHSYIEGANDFGYKAVLKFAADFADGAKTKTVDQLSAYLDDSLYVTYTINGTNNGGQHIEVALQDSSDVTNAAAFKAIVDTSKLNNYSVCATHYGITAKPVLHSKSVADINLADDYQFVWNARYTVTKHVHNALYQFNNDWAYEKGTGFVDSVVFAIDKADTAFFVSNDIATKDGSKTTKLHALNTTTIAKAADSKKLKFTYKTSKFDTLAVKDTVVVPYENNSNIGEVTIVITTGIAPIIKGTDAVEAFDAATDSIRLNFKAVVPYYAGKADSSWINFPANKDSLLYKNLLNKTVISDSAALKLTLGTQTGLTAVMQNGKKLNYSSTYVDTLKVTFGDAQVANYTYEFPFSVKTIECPFKVISTLDVDSVSVGKLIDGGSLRYHHDSIDVSKFYKVVYSKDSTAYTGEEPVKVALSCGKDTAYVNTANGILSAHKFSVDSLLKYKTIFASSVYRTSVSNKENVESKKFVERSPITAFTLKDSIKVSRPVAKADTVRINGENGFVIKLEASDITLTNAWDSLKWEVKGEDFFGQLDFIDSTNVTFKYSDRVVKVEGYVQNEPSFTMKLDSANKPMIVLGEAAQRADYIMTIPYVGRKYLDENEIQGNLVIRFTKN